MCGYQLSIIQYPLKFKEMQVIKTKIYRKKAKGSKMARRRVLFVDWRAVDGSANGKRKLELKENNNGKFTCPAKMCLHADFKSKRGLRKHIDNKHPWYYYFDEQPEVKREEIEQRQPEVQKRASTISKPHYSIEEGIGLDFYQWLCTSCGGGKSDREAKQIGKRALKFLMQCTGENESDTPLSFQLIDCCLGSPSIIMNFFSILEKEWKLSSSGSLNYVKSIVDLMDFRKANGVNDNNLRCFTVTEVYLRRAKENLRKKKRVDSTRNFDLETLIGRDSWATLEDMEKVLPYHSEKFKSIIERCKNQSPLPNKQELSFCTRFVTTFLFLRVKCSRPMTFQYLTLPMIEKAKINEGFIDQTEFKTAAKYVFDTLILNNDVFAVLDVYIDFVRPLLKPKCEYLLVSTTGNQYQSLTTAMTILVYEAIGKYIHPTRYRQIVETTSADRLNREEQEVISEDQKHSSNVAKVHYKKKQSRNVAIEGKRCMEKMLGSARIEQQQSMSSFFNDMTSMRSTDLASSSSSSTSSATGQYLSFPSAEMDNENLENDIFNNPYEPVTTVSTNEIGCTMQIQENIDTMFKRVQEMYGNESGQSSNLNDSGDIEMIVTKCTPPTTFVPKFTYNKAEIENNVNIKKELASKEVKKVSKATKNIKFSGEEDLFLLRGIKKHGLKNWSAILKDDEYTFQKSRTRDSLRVRADSAAFKKLLSDEKLY